MAGICSGAKAPFAVFSSPSSSVKVGMLSCVWPSWSWSSTFDSTAAAFSLLLHCWRVGGRFEDLYEYIVTDSVTTRTPTAKYTIISFGTHRKFS